MKLPVRWCKILRDFQAIQGRAMMMIAAIAIGLLSVTAIAAATAILTREIGRNYKATHPASALIDVGRVPVGLIERLRRDPDLTAVEAGTIVTARAERRPGEWTRLLIFVVPDFRALAVNRVFPERGVFPPATGTILVEREALALLNGKIGDVLNLRLPDGTGAQLPIVGVVHDPGLAPAWQEETVYGYMTFETYAALGQSAAPELLKIVVRGGQTDQARTDRVVARIASDLKREGIPVHQVQVPPAGAHPHQTQMTSILAMFLAFTLLGLGLSAILTASMIDGLLAAQVRQIAVMKAIGAKAEDISRLYLGGVAGIAMLAVMIGLPLGLMGGSAFADVIAQLLNFDIASHAVSPWLVAVLIAGGVIVPVAFAAVPVRSALKRTIRAALDDHGVADGSFGKGWIDRSLSRLSGLDRTLLMAQRNAFRRRRRLMLTVGLLAAAGALFLASLGVQSAWDGFVAASAGDRRHDIEVRLDRPMDQAVLAGLGEIPGVARVEGWPAAPAAPARDDTLALTRTYPDGGHGSLELRGMPAAGSLAHLIVLEGASALLADRQSVVLNQGAHALLGRPSVGTRVGLIVDGKVGWFKVQAIVREILTLPAVYLTSDTFAVLCGEPGRTNVIRITSATHAVPDLARLAATIDDRLRSTGIHVTGVLTEAQVGGAVSGHVRIMVVSLIVLSALMAAVGLLGLASAQGASVAERTREFGIMRTLGATGRVIMRNVMAEGLTIASLSLPLAVAIGLPFAFGIGFLVGKLSFGLPLQLAFPAFPIVLWATIVTVGAIAASLAPALAAARLTIRQTLMVN